MLLLPLRDLKKRDFYVTFVEYNRNYIFYQPGELCCNRLEVFFSSKLQQICENLRELKIHKNCKYYVTSFDTHCIFYVLFRNIWFQTSNQPTMKKLNIFTQMKRTSRGDLSGQISPNPSAPTDTLGRIVNAKEEVKRIFF